MQLWLWNIAPGAAVVPSVDQTPPVEEAPGPATEAPVVSAAPTNCASDLVAGKYETNEKKASKLCSKYDASQIAKAIALAKDGVTDSFSSLLREVAKYNDDEIECARLAWHAAVDAGKKKSFSVRKECRHP